MDLTLYNVSDAVRLNNQVVSRYTVNSAPDDPTTTERLRVICNKVLKYLLTYRGSDAYDASYGSLAIHRKHISPALLPEIRMELLEDIADCTRYLQTAEAEKLDDSEERLSSITLVSMNYDRQADPTRLDIYLLIQTTYGNRAVIEV